jgi:hypothetical protein
VIAFSLAPVEAALDLHDEDVPTPPFRVACWILPEPFVRPLHKVEEPNVMAPRNLCNKLLHNWLVRPSFR